MKKLFFAMTMATCLTNVHAIEANGRVAVRPMGARTEWMAIQKITQVEVETQGNKQQHTFFYYMKNGQAAYVAVNATEDPVIHSLLFTAYLTGTPAEIGMNYHTGFVNKARIKN